MQEKDKSVFLYDKHGGSLPFGRESFFIFIHNMSGNRTHENVYKYQKNKITGGKPR